jgi:hypothetical protein
MNPRIPFLRLIAITLLIIGLTFVSISLNLRPASAQGGSVQVTAADPASTVQGTINLNVTVNGKGFKNGAKAQWFVTGTTDTGGVTVNSTTFVSSTQLTANITVSDTATVANFDIAVVNGDGRGGKGTELFAVTQKNAQPSCGTDVTNLSISIYKYTDATNTTTYNLWPDLTNTDGTPVPYVSGKTKGQNIDGRIQIDNCTYDLTLNLNFSKRYFTWKFPNGSVVGTSANASGFNLDRLGTVPITDGGANNLNWCNTSTDNYGGCGVDGSGAYFVRRSLGSGILNDSYGVRFQYSPIDNVQTTAAGTAYVRIYHPDANTWIIIPDIAPPPPSVTGTDGEWSVLLDKSTNPGSVVGYQKMPFKMVITKF